MRALVIPCLWAVAATLLTVALMIVFGQSAVSRFHGPLRVLVYEPVVDEMRCAACSEDAATVSRVLARHPDVVNAGDADGWTALHEAARAGSTQVVTVLLENGADVNARNSDGNTPLHVAAKAGEPTVARLLTEAHADIDARNNNGQTPMELVKGNRWRQLAKTLCREGGYAGSAVF